MPSSSDSSYVLKTLFGAIVSGVISFFGFFLIGYLAIAFLPGGGLASHFGLAVVYVIESTQKLLGIPVGGDVIPVFVLWSACTALATFLYKQVSRKRV